MQNRQKLHISYLQSFCLAFAATVLIAFVIPLIVSSIFIDFIHGNPNRTQVNAIISIVIFIPVILIFIFPFFIVTFFISQSIEYIILYFIIDRIKYYPIIILLIPLITTSVSWLCYDYLTPSQSSPLLFQSDDWVPFHHGLSFERYLKLLPLQYFLTGINLTFFRYRQSNIQYYYIALGVLIVVLGSVQGYLQAVQQYRFL